MEYEHVSTVNDCSCSFYGWRFVASCHWSSSSWCHSPVLYVPVMVVWVNDNPQCWKRYDTDHNMYEMMLCGDCQTMWRVWGGWKVKFWDVYIIIICVNGQIFNQCLLGVGVFVHSSGCMRSQVQIPQVAHKVLVLQCSWLSQRVLIPLTRVRISVRPFVMYFSQISSHFITPQHVEKSHFLHFCYQLICTLNYPFYTFAMCYHCMLHINGTQYLHFSWWH